MLQTMDRSSSITGLEHKCYEYVTVDDACASQHGGYSNTLAAFLENGSSLGWKQKTEEMMKEQEDNERRRAYQHDLEGHDSSAAEKQGYTSSLPELPASIQDALDHLAVAAADIPATRHSAPATKATMPTGGSVPCGVQSQDEPAKKVSTASNKKAKQPKGPGGQREAARKVQEGQSAKSLKIESRNRQHELCNQERRALNTATAAAAAAAAAINNNRAARKAAKRAGQLLSTAAASDPSSSSIAAIEAPTALVTAVVVTCENGAGTPAANHPLNDVQEAAASVPSGMGLTTEHAEPAAVATSVMQAAGSPAANNCVSPAKDAVAPVPSGLASPAVSAHAEPEAAAATTEAAAGIPAVNNLVNNAKEAAAPVLAGLGLSAAFSQAEPTKVDVAAAKAADTPAINDHKAVKKVEHGKSGKRSKINSRDRRHEEQYHQQRKLQIANAAAAAAAAAVSKAARKAARKMKPTADSCPGSLIVTDKGVQSGSTATVYATGTACNGPAVIDQVNDFKEAGVQVLSGEVITAVPAKEQAITSATTVGKALTIPASSDDSNPVEQMAALVLAGLGLTAVALAQAEPTPAAATTTEQAAGIIPAVDDHNTPAKEAAMHVATGLGSTASSAEADANTTSDASTTETMQVTARANSMPAGNNVVTDGNDDTTSAVQAGLTAMQPPIGNHNRAPLQAWQYGHNSTVPGLAHVHHAFPKHTNKPHKPPHHRVSSGVNAHAAPPRYAADVISSCGAPHHRLSAGFDTSGLPGNHAPGSMNRHGAAHDRVTETANACSTPQQHDFAAINPHSAPHHPAYHVSPYPAPQQFPAFPNTTCGYQPVNGYHMPMPSQNPGLINAGFALPPHIHGHYDSFVHPQPVFVVGCTSYDMYCQSNMVFVPQGQHLPMMVPVQQVPQHHMMGFPVYPQPVQFTQWAPAPGIHHPAPPPPHPTPVARTLPTRIRHPALAGNAPRSPRPGGWHKAAPAPLVR